MSLPLSVRTSMADEPKSTSGPFLKGHLATRLQEELKTSPEVACCDQMMWPSLSDSATMASLVVVAGWE